jgi:bifunctional ADP-heptose synthase (sugar kinase/adenylyltransferase)
MSKNKKVLVIGDVIIDRYIRGSRKGISAETPTIVANFLSEQVYAGGAALVARHLARLQCNVVLSTALDYTGTQKLGEILRVHEDFLGDDGAFCTPYLKDVDGQKWVLNEKRRYYVDDYKMVQYDLLNRQTHNNNSLKEMLSIVKAVKADAIVIADNRHGTVTGYLASKIIEHCYRNKIELYVDSQVSQYNSNLDDYTDAKNIFLNEKEWFAYYEDTFSDNLDVAVDRIKDNGWKNVYVKCGKNGAYHVDANNGTVKHYPPYENVDVKDTCGAGDAFMAALIATGDVEKANKWAAISTQYIGTVVPCEREEIL